MKNNDLADLVVAARDLRAHAGERPDRDTSLTAIRRGFYRPASAELNQADDHLLRVLATARAREGGLVFSHASAAVLWGAPVMNAGLEYVEATQPGRPRRSTARVRMHRSPVPNEHLVELPSGLLVTSREWTAVQVAAAGVLPDVLLPLDDLVRQISHAAGCDQRAVIDALVALVPPRTRGCARAVRNLQLANALSGSAGESLSRGQMLRIGVPMPELQVRFSRIDQPGHDVVDFDWPGLDSFGEFDGQGKYFRDELRNGRTPEQVLWEEKVREDRVRRHRARAARWGWDVARSRTRLAQVLAAAGIHPTPGAGLPA